MQLKGWVFFAVEKEQQQKRWSRTPRSSPHDFSESLDRKPIHLFAWKLVRWPCTGRWFLPNYAMSGSWSICKKKRIDERITFKIAEKSWGKIGYAHTKTAENLKTTFLEIIIQNFEINQKLNSIKYQMVSISPHRSHPPFWTGSLYRTEVSKRARRRTWLECPFGVLETEWNRPNPGWDAERVLSFAMLATLNACMQSVAPSNKTLDEVK